MPDLLLTDPSEDGFHSTDACEQYRAADVQREVDGDLNLPHCSSRSMHLGASRSHGLTGGSYQPQNPSAMSATGTCVPGASPA